MKRILALTLALVASVSVFGMEYPGEKSSWEGCDKYTFQVEGRQAIVVVPKEAAPGSPWIWRPAFFNAFPSVDKALLADGWHVAYYDVTHFYGSPRGVELSKAFYDYVVPAFGLSSKMTVEGFSRGGYMAFAWAGTYPETVSCLYVDAPVCDLTSWPSRNSGLWQDVLDEWGVADSEIDGDFRGNALQHLPVLAAAHIPIISVCGLADEVVPFKDNMAKVRDAYQNMGGVVELITKPDCGHHPHSLEDPEPVVDFIKRYADGYTSWQDVRLRGNLDNSLAAMTRGDSVTVAFFGGSITEMKGWHNMIMDDLRQRYPQARFKFLQSGIGSLGSTPHAFRMEEDVLSHGIPDLLFIEAAVNDHTNYFGPREQVLGMEGVVRHALKVNPSMDIVMMHFIYDPFLPMMEDGEMPDVVLNHDRVANHYHVTSINLVQEISARMGDGQFDWKRFGGTHPAWFGHKFYAAAIDRVFDAFTKPAAEYAPAAHRLPSEPLDPACYDGGCQVDVREAAKLKGFAYVEDWYPDNGFEKRRQYAHKPMLSTTSGGSLELSFEGRAVGIYGCFGPDAAVLEYRIDGGKWKKMDTYTEWSPYLYIPWVYVFDRDLDSGKHLLKLRIAKGERSGCIIKSFVVNK